MQENKAFTKAEEGSLKPVNSETVQGVVLSTKDVEEYRAYKRRKMVEEIMTAMSKSETSVFCEEETQRACEYALRLKQAALQVTPLQIVAVKKRLYGEKNFKETLRWQFSKDSRVKKDKKKECKRVKSVKLDCLIGGDGETSTYMKAKEAKYALRLGAKELTLVLAPSLIKSGKFVEIRKEIRKIYRLRKRSTLKVWVAGDYPIATIGRLARIASEVGAKYFCVPYFAGCDRVRFDLINGCKLQVSGARDLAEYKKMLATGIGRIVTGNIGAIYEAWMKETENVEFAKPALLVRERKVEPSEFIEEQDENIPTIEAPKKQPLPLSKVVQSGLRAEEKTGLESEKVDG